MPVWQPRMAATLFVPSAGSAQDRKNQEKTDQVFRFDVRPFKVRLVSNNFNRADECDLTFAYDECGLDPRFLRSAEAYVYIEDQASFGEFIPGPTNLRFVGIARDVDREFDETSGKVIAFKLQDYTCLFLEMKNFPQDGVPLFSDTLQSAWARVCANTGYLDLDTHEIVSTVDNLTDRLVLLGPIDPNITLGSAVPARIAKLGRLQVNHASEAWAVWQAAVGSLGLVSWIRGDQCFVANATDFYTADDPPFFLWGLNIRHLHEGRHLGDLSAKPVCVRSYDPTEGHTLESLWPPPEHAIKKKRLGAHAAKKPPKVVHTQDYECFDLPFACADQKTLDNITKRIWDERTRQELSGTLKTRKMSVATVNGSQSAFDLLNLQAGDQIQVEIERGALDAIQGLATIGERALALITRGYSADMAKFIAANLADIDKLPSQFLVHEVTTEIEATGAEGGCSYDCEIAFVNRIDITAGGTIPIGAGSATNQATGTDKPPIAGQKVTTMAKT